MAGASLPAYCSRTKWFDEETFNSKIYGHSSVKSALKKAQHDKCAFCEARVTHISYGDVEHYRPKAGFKQHESDPLGRPGYYWLAYEWSNLLFACQLCNQQFKRNLFPLRDPKRRALCHTDDLKTEEALLLNPAETDSGEHLRFRRGSAVLYPFRNSLAGQTTIAVLGLKRPTMVEKRRAYLRLVKGLLEVHRGVKAMPDTKLTPQLRTQRRKITVLLEEITADEAEYAAMARAALRGS